MKTTPADAKANHSSAPRELFQSVWVTFSDGTRAGFVGKAAAIPGDSRTIENIEFTEPKPLPPNCSFGEF